MQKFNLNISAFLSLNSRIFIKSHHILNLKCPNEVHNFVQFLFTEREGLVLVPHA